MKVILLVDDRKLGKKGQIVEVNDGYARNYVLPKKVGMEATPKNLMTGSLRRHTRIRLLPRNLQRLRLLLKSLRIRRLQHPLRLVLTVIPSVLYLQRKLQSLLRSSWDMSSIRRKSS